VFNGRDTIKRLYESLERQTYKNFEWIVIDDGSRDDSWKVARELGEKSEFVVRVFRQKNGHKKVAVNRGVALARGELVLIADDDDELAEDALAIFDRWWRWVDRMGRRDIVGVTGLCIDERGRLVGDRFPRSPMVATDLMIRLRDRVKGEKWGAKRTDIMIKFPYPENIRGYVPESVV